MQEKRKVERFDLRVETRLRVHGLSAGPETIQFFSRDVSSSGIFLMTEKPLPLGTMVDVTMAIENELAGVPAKKTITLNNSGMVIRTSRQGMAIHFKKQSQLASG